jgi:hypothetical protein
VKQNETRSDLGQVAEAGIHLPEPTDAIPKAAHETHGHEDDEHNEHDCELVDILRVLICCSGGGSLVPSLRAVPPSKCDWVSSDADRRLSHVKEAFENSRRHVKKAIFFWNRSVSRLLKIPSHNRDQVLCRLEL